MKVENKSDIKARLLWESTVGKKNFVILSFSTRGVSQLLIFYIPDGDYTPQTKCCCLVPVLVPADTIICPLCTETQQAASNLLSVV